MGMEIEVVEVKSEYTGNHVVTHTAKLQVEINVDYKVIKDIVNEVWELLPESVDIDAKEHERYKDVGMDPASMKIEDYVRELEDEFKRVFEKELIKELQVEYEIKSIKKEIEKYEIEVVFKEEFDSDWWEEKEIIDNIEEFKENFKEELVAVIEDALGNAKHNIAEKIAKKILIENLCKEEEPSEEVPSKGELSEEPVEEFKRAIIVGSKDFYITLPKNYLKYLYKKFGKVPKWVVLKYYKNGRIVIEPLLHEKDIPREKLEWFGITKL